MQPLARFLVAAGDPHARRIARWRDAARSRGGFLVATIAWMAATAAVAATLAVGSEVRVRASGLGDGWRTGRIVKTRPGCLMIRFDAPAAGGYTSASLGGVSALELREGGGWRAIDVKPIHAAEPADCMGDND
jgi:hypothetical protein